MTRDACEGTQVFGATGSGKTSGSGRALARAFLENGFGGLVLWTKNDEPEFWLRYAREIGRESDIIQLSREQFNFLAYEAHRLGEWAGQTENLVTLFMQMVEIANQRHGHATADLYWERAVTTRTVLGTSFVLPNPLNGHVARRKLSSLKCNGKRF